ncbi:MAG: SsrA-binding protein SmpB [Amoebophilaceae bacterium]|jgi:SsrA-binding protein|nr:SsrA-binding protein SmpB [Amoebophilaceae bacterium]
MALQGKKAAKNIVIKNKRASFEYTFLDKYTAGMVLTGTEIKSIRAGKVSLQEAYCYFAERALWVKGMHIAAYEQGNIYNHVENRERKLLLNKRELKKLLRNKEKGLTIIPVQLFINERGLAKLQIALSKGKKLHDKRRSIREREAERTMRRDQVQ